MARILVADDDESILDMIGYALKGAGYTVETVTDGQQALDILERNRPDLLILDIAMAPLDGYTVVTRLRDDPKMSSLPVIVVTGRGQIQSFLHQHANVRAFIEKPFSPAQIVAIATGILKKG